MSNMIDENPKNETENSVDEIWLEEAEKRLIAYREGKLESFSMEEVFVKLYKDIDIKRI